MHFYTCNTCVWYTRIWHVCNMCITGVLHMYRHLENHTCGTFGRVHQCTIQYMSIYWAYLADSSCYHTSLHIKTLRSVSVWLPTCECLTGPVGYWLLPWLPIWSPTWDAPLCVHSLSRWLPGPLTSYRRTGNHLGLDSQDIHIYSCFQYFLHYNCQTFQYEYIKK